MVALVFCGCMRTGQHSMAAPRSASGHNENQFCSWTFEQGPSGKIFAGSMVVTNKAGGACTIFNSGNKLYIGDAPNGGKEVSDIGAVEFVTKGSCRHCYLNTFGGMTCVAYPGSC
jgi:hypothetical protein